VLIDANFVVDPSNGNGLGIRSLKGPGVQAVYMHATPAATTTTSVFPSGATIITVANLTNLVVGEVVTDSTTSGNIAGGTTIVSINPANNQITLSAATLGASASAPGDTLSFAMTAALAGNPNPPAGYIYLHLHDNYNRYYSGFSGFVAPVSGTPLTSVTANLVYIITSLGTGTQAQWAAIGLEPGVVPSVGAAFVASTSASVPGGGTVEARAAGGSGIDHIEVVGDPNQTCSPQQAKGAVIISVCLFEGAVTAPATGTVISLASYMSNGSNTVKGE